jgi:hypothetical protein
MLPSGLQLFTGRGDSTQCRSRCRLLGSDDDPRVAPAGIEPASQALQASADPSQLESRTGEGRHLDDPRPSILSFFKLANTQWSLTVGQPLRQGPHDDLLL